MKPRNSLERILAVLEVFSEDRLEWTPEELMAELGYSRPTLYRYLKTLKEAGLLTSLPNAGFTLGPKVVELDYLMRKSDPLILHGRRHLRHLSGLAPCTALAVRWYGNRILCIDSVCSSENPLSSYPRGRPMPLGRGAIARSILASLPRRRLIPLIERNLEELRAVGLGETVEDIHQAMKRVRRRGVAIARGEVTPGAIGIAAPVFDAGQTPLGSLCVTVAAELVDDAGVERLAGEVLEAARMLSEELGRHRTRNSVDNLTE